MSLLPEQIERTLRARQSLPPAPQRRLIRENAGLTQTEMAAACDVDRISICRWEAGGNPAKKLLVRYVEVLTYLQRETDDDGTVR